jgi:hypothetical protein
MINFIKKLLFGTPVDPAQVQEEVNRIFAPTVVAKVEAVVKPDSKPVNTTRVISNSKVTSQTNPANKNRRSRSKPKVKTTK